MIIKSVCNSCFQVFDIYLQPSDVELVKQIAMEDGRLCPCPRLCGGKINLVGDPNIEKLAENSILREPMSITGTQLYQAVKGMGLPDEIPKDVTVVDSVLRANPIKSVLLEDHNGRLYLHELHLNEGTTVHLTAGPRGAMVLKVTKERTDGVRNPS